MINIDNISKSFGGQVLFEKAGFQINPGEKVGLVGRNGHGKTTLLKMLTHDEAPDDGQILFPSDYRLGYLTQTISFSRETVLEECMTGLPPQEGDAAWKAEKILAGLGFSTRDMQARPETFSGGFQVRLTLATVLVSDPDMLILDEPTNYLDITSIRWLIGFLNAWPRELLLVTHDRGFMDAVVTHTAGIHRRVIRKIEGDTAKYYQQIAQDEEIYEKTRLNEEKRRKEMETFVTRFRAKARLAGLVQSRVKALDRMEKKTRLEKIDSLSFSFRQRAFAGRQLLTGEHLHFAYDSRRPLIEDFNLTVQPGDRIAIVGKNGQGKTTLLKLLAGILNPSSGRLAYNPGVSTGYFEQTNIQTLNPQATVEEEILGAHPDVDRQQARNICGAMMFEGDDALKRISVLSGGEKSRVMLGKLLVEPLNLLMLDEPTNHLDMDTCDAMLSALETFEGAVLLVTHNEMFLHALANRLVVFKSDRVTVFEDGYGAFLEKEGWDETAPETQNNNSDPDGTVPEDGIKLSRKALRKQRSDIIARRSRMLGPLEKKISKTEGTIEKKEAALAAYHQEMQAASEAGDGTRIQDLSCRIAGCQDEIDRLFSSLETDMDELDEQQQQFQRELDRLEK